jgi:hypothetical protein
VAQARNNDIGPVTIEEARLIFRNFSGAEGKYNREGDRNFNVLIPTDVAEAMEKDGWNIKWLEPREEGDERQARLEVAVSYKGRPPRIVMITHKGKVTLTESMLSILDWVEIKNADLIIRPYQWDVNGRQGIKAYLQSLFVTIREDALEIKYSDVGDAPDSAKGSLTEAYADEAPF